MLSFLLFPFKKTKKSLDYTERLALSFALSLAIIPIIGLCLNYTPWGLQITPIFLSILIFVIAIGAVNLFRWKQTPQKRRIETKIKLFPLKFEKNIDTILNIIIITSIIIAIILISYSLVFLRTDKPFTEFYILGSDGKVVDYQRDILLGEKSSIIIGVANHEYKTIDYTIEIWLLNQTTINNETTPGRETIYNNMWYLDKLNVSLEHTKANIDKPWEPQWEYSYNLNINKTGDLNLLFLLYKNATENYLLERDYSNIAEKKINEAYRLTNLWITISDQMQG